MPALLRGVVICDGCGATATATAQYSHRLTRMWWDLPEGWELHEGSNNSMSIYCKTACNKWAAVSHADQTGKRKVEPLCFDPRTIDKISELAETAHPDANAVLAAIEAVLIAWRRKEKAAS